MAAPVDHLQWHDVEAALRARLVSDLGRGRPEDPPRDPAEVRRRFDEVDALVAAEAMLGPGWSAPLRDARDVDEALGQARRGAALDPATLAEIADTLGAIEAARGVGPALTEAIAQRPELADVAAALRARLAELADVDALARRLDAALDRSSPDGEVGLADAASPELARARQRLRQARGDLARRADRLVRGFDLSDALADRYWTERQGRVVVPLLASRLAGSSAHAGIIHGSSGSGQTLFVEPPQLVEDNNRLRRAELAERAEVRRVLESLSAAVGREASALAASLRALARVDHIVARRRLGDDLGGHRPDVVDPAPGETLRLPAARHPLMVLAGVSVVPNDIVLAVGRTLVVSGPNAGGKTVALKTAGLCVRLSWAGVRIPAGPGACVPLFRHVVTDVGDDQSIEQDLSTFSAHLTHVRAALDSAEADGDGTLVLLDEVAAGTEPRQGAALAEAVLVALGDRGATTIATTHYDRLKLLAGERPDRFVNAAVGFDLEAMRPTFTLRIGTPGTSSAIAVARRLGLPGAVLDAAERALGQAERDTDALLRQLEGERTRLAATRAELDAEAAELARERARLSARESGELETAHVRKAKAQRALASSLHELEAEIDRRRKRLRKAPAEAPAPGQASPAVADARQLARKARAEIAAAAEPGPRGTAPEVAVGDRVRVASLGATGEVLAVKGGRVVVQLPNAKMTVARADLDLAAPRPRPRPQPKASRPAATRAAAFFGADAKDYDPSFDDVVDLRGQRVDEAATAVEVFVDRAVGADRDVVVIRHGHGSGALRSTVREVLDRLGHVVTHRPGHPAEGGDAVTVVWVRG